MVGRDSQEPEDLQDIAGHLYGARAEVHDPGGNLRQCGLQQLVGRLPAQRCSSS